MKIENIFDEVDNLKERVIKDILNNQELLKLISVNNDNPLDSPDILGASKLVDQCIFFKPKVYDTTVKGVQSFLLTDIIVSSIRGKPKFADIKLIFRVIVHNALFELYDGKTRAYQVASRLTYMFSDVRGSWIGDSSFESCNPIEVPSDYQGIQLVFSVSDFKK